MMFLPFAERLNTKYSFQVQSGQILQSVFCTPSKISFFVSRLRLYIRDASFIQIFFSKTQTQIFISTSECHLVTQSSSLILYPLTAVEIQCVSKIQIYHQLKTCMPAKSLQLPFTLLLKYKTKNITWK